MLETIQNNKNILFLKYKVKNHLVIKQKILNDIKAMGEFSYIERDSISNQKISNTDYHLNTDFIRYYKENLTDIFQDMNKCINELYFIDHKLCIINYWFQQYKKGDFHKWHIHKGCVFSCVYYVDINNETSKTTFKLFDKSEIEIEMNEGEILIFPSFLEHASLKNPSNKTKTVISFNIN